MTADPHRQTAASLGPDSVVRLLDVHEYVALCDAANRLGRTWKSKLLITRTRGGEYSRLGIPAEHHVALHRAINRLGTRLLDLVAVQTVTDGDGPGETTLIGGPK
jgi:hypothetical protein